MAIQNKYNMPLFYWHLELASKCALACPRCPRTGPENKHKYNVTEMPLENLKKIFTPELLKTEVKKIMLCGGQGDPIYYSQLHEFIEYVKIYNPTLRFVIITNGSYRKKDWWEKLASLLTEHDRIVFSIDGWDQQSNEIYRRGSNFESIMEGLGVMARSKAVIFWSTIIFKFNQDKLSDIENLAKSKGVHYFHAVRSTKFGPHWADETGQDPLQPRDEFLLATGPYSRNEKVLTEIQMKDPISDLIKERQKSFPEGLIHPACKSGERGLYVDASGYMYACSWISHPYDMPMKPGQDNVWISQTHRFNVFERPLEAVINDQVWEQLFNTWKHKENLYPVCAEKCSAI